MRKFFHNNSSMLARFNVCSFGPKLWRHLRITQLSISVYFFSINTQMHVYTLINGRTHDAHWICAWVKWEMGWELLAIITYFFCWIKIVCVFVWNTKQLKEKRHVMAYAIYIFPRQVSALWRRLWWLKPRKNKESTSSGTHTHIQ